MSEGHGNTYMVENPEDFEYPINLCYNGIQGLKKAGVKTELTQEQASEIERCMDDPIYFVETYCKILHVDEGVIPFQPYEYQKKMIRNMIENRFNINILPRQYGKCYRGNSKYAVRNKTTGEILHVTAEEFHDIVSERNREE